MRNRLNFVFDRVVVINLDRRPDRMREFDRQANENQLFYQRYSAVDAVVEKIHPDLACRMSHRKVLEDAMRDGVGNLFVFEDDALFCDDFNTRFDEFYQQIPEDKWDMLYLGAWIHAANPFSDNIVRLLDSFSAHAYGIHHQMMQKCLDATWKDFPIDIVYSQLHASHNVYCAKPALVSQRPGFSDLIREYRDVTDKYV